MCNACPGTVTDPAGIHDADESGGCPGSRWGQLEGISEDML